MNTCHDCGATEGMFHDLGCDMERCPFCGGQLLSCDCGNLSDRKYIKKLVEKGRIPWVAIYPRCAICGNLWDEIWMTTDEEWQKYAIPELQKECLCKPCFENLKKIFPDGWRNAKRYKHPFTGIEQ